jgi:hypothetical protein
MLFIFHAKASMAIKRDLKFASDPWRSYSDPQGPPASLD